MSFDDGMKLFKTANYRAAAEQFAAVTEQDENNHKAWNALGICLSKIGQYDQAATCFENALELSPENATYRKNQAGNEAKRSAEPDLELDTEPSVQQKVRTTRSEYQRNWLQIPLYFVPMILCFVNPVVGFLSIIPCAYYIKTDADSLGAGKNPNGSIWGKMKGWEWMVLLILFWILLPLYSWKREGVFNENLGYGSYHGSSSGSGISLLKLGAGFCGFIIFCVIVAAFVSGMAGSSIHDTETYQSVTKVQSAPTAVTTSVPVQQITVQATPAATREQVVEQTTGRATIAEKNAAKKALSYLKYSAFSRDGLIKQLEYEKFSHAEAEYGVDQSGADWNEQAAKKAKSYLEHSSFSREGLIKQLEYEKFTPQQAEYGVQSVGL